MFLIMIYLGRATLLFSFILILRMKVLSMNATGEAH